MSFGDVGTGTSTVYAAGECVAIAPKRGREAESLSSRSLLLLRGMRGGDPNELGWIVCNLRAVICGP